MLTNPNTLACLKRTFSPWPEIVHGAGGLLYYDGANLNAIMGMARPGDMGFDVVHVNLHKTFATPHGGGGPGSGPVGAKAHLAPFLPVPVLQKDGGAYRWDFDRPLSIGQMHAFYGNVGVVVKAYAYMLAWAAEGTATRVAWPFWPPTICAYAWARITTFATTRCASTNSCSPPPGRCTKIMWARRTFASV